MKKIFLIFTGLLFSVIAFFPLNFSAQNEVACSAGISTAQGPVIGADDGKNQVCVYKGVPYAAPPIGDLRWKASLPPAKRSVPLKALNFGAQCVQPGSEMPLGIGGQKDQSEDCLYLNIWRPKKSGAFPVMLWIHGGDLMQGSGARSFYHGGALSAKEDVVVVTINYRLGPFGYLYHPAFAEEDPHHSSGNYGVLDQVAALKWVSENIQAFGGDPRNVTIFGESAGGWSVCYLLATPLARGLFQKAIMESGGCQTYRTLEEGKKIGAGFSARLGCGGEKVAECMRRKSPQEVIAALGKDWLAMLAKFDGHVDGHVFKEPPLEALKSGRYNNVPFMVGSTRDEFKLFRAEIKGASRMSYQEIWPAMEKYMPVKLSPGIEKLYPAGAYPKPVDALLDALGDAYMGCPNFRAAEASAIHQPKTFYYRFDFDESIVKNYYGAAHAMEVPFVFGNVSRPPISLIYMPAQKRKAGPLMDEIMGYWANFARSGDPNRNGLEKCEGSGLITSARYLGRVPPWRDCIALGQGKPCPYENSARSSAKRPDPEKSTAFDEGLPDWPAYDLKDRKRMILDLPLKVAPADMSEKCGFWARQDYVFR